MHIDVELPNGSRTGDGPITTATGASWGEALDRAAEFSFEMPAEDPRGALIVDHPKRVVRAWGPLYPGGPLVELGAGVVDKWETVPGVSGSRLRVSGSSLLRELTYTSVGFLALSDGAGLPIAIALAAIMAYAPAGWALDGAGYATTGVLDYGAFAGELTLEALRKLHEHNGQHFRRGPGRTVRALRADLADCGLRALAAGDPIALEGNPLVCLIDSVSEAADAFDQLTRIHAYGAGNGQSRLTLAHTNRAAPAGYTLDLANNLLINTAAETALGVQITRYLSWKEIGPISNSDPDLQSAANVLFDATLRELATHATPQKTYRLRVRKLGKLVYPGEQLRVVWSGWADVLDGFGAKTGDYHYINLNALLTILEVVYRVDGGGNVVADLTVSTIDRWPVSSAEIQAQQMAAGTLMEAHPQLTIAYSPVGPYTRRMDATHPASFVVRIGKEVTALNYAILRFRTGPLTSSIKSVASASTTTSSGGSSTPTSATGGGGTVTSQNGSDHTHKFAVNLGATGGLVHLSGNRLYAEGSGGNPETNTEVAAHSHGVTFPTHTHSVAVPAHTHDVTPAITANYGIYQDGTYPTGLSLYIDGVDRTVALGGPWAAGGGAAAAELELTAYLLANLRSNHTVEFRCASGQGEVEVECDLLLSIQSIAMV